jgi:hypothetical protein
LAYESSPNVWLGAGLLPPDFVFVNGVLYSQPLSRELILGVLSTKSFGEGRRAFFIELAKAIFSTICQPIYDYLPVELKLFSVPTV